MPNVNGEALPRESLVAELLHYFKEDRYLTGRRQKLIAVKPVFARWTSPQVVNTLAGMCDEKLHYQREDGTEVDLRLLAKDSKTASKGGTTYLLTPLGAFMRDLTDGQAELPKRRKKAR